MATYVDGALQPQTRTRDFSQQVHDDIHNLNIAFGKSGDQSGDNWATQNSLTPFVAISGAGDFGADANDEALVIGADDTPVQAGVLTFDIHEIEFGDLSADTLYIVEVLWGTGTIAQAIAASNNKTHTQVQNVTAAGLSNGAPSRLVMPDIPSGTKVWVRVKCGTDNATASFTIDLNEFPAPV